MPVWVVSARESAERDRAAIESGTPSRHLMERAGTAAAREISRRYTDRLRDGAVVFTGPGNNGGDGWVVARALADTGVEVTVVEVAKPTGKAPDAVAEREAAMPLVKLAESVDDNATVVVDAVLGTGFEGEPRGKIGEAIATINELRGRGARVASLDVPSGLDATTGQHSACVIADITLSFGGLKRGTLLARDCCGEIVVLDIGLDMSPNAKNPGAGGQSLPMLVDGEWVRTRIPSIRFDAHKGIRKHRDGRSGEGHAWRRRARCACSAAKRHRHGTSSRRTGKRERSPHRCTFGPNLRMAVERKSDKRRDLELGQCRGDRTRTRQLGRHASARRTNCWQLEDSHSARRRRTQRFRGRLKIPGNVVGGKAGVNNPSRR